MKLVVFTDLDATLLDARTYRYDEARDALDELRKVGAVLVLVSSKTFVEMEPLNRELGFCDPFIVENGGAIVVSADVPMASMLRESRFRGEPFYRGDSLLLPLGASYETLVQSLHAISVETDLHLRGISAMDNEELAALTGLTTDAAEKARQRDFDEPFIVYEQVPENAGRVMEAAERRGLRVLIGGKFWHLVGHEGKGEAVSLLIDAYRRLYGSIFTVGLGDSPNDFSFLDLMDVPVLVGHAETLEAPFDTQARARRVPEAGPTGWNLAIHQILLER